MDESADLTMDPSQSGSNVRVSQAHRIEAVRQLASGIAHEFANALTAIAGMAYLLRDELSLDPQSEEDFNEIRRITQEAAFLARELMAFGSSGAADPTRRRLSEIVKQLRRLLPHVLPPPISVVERLAPGDMEVWADPQQMSEIVIVVAAHARDLMPAGGELLIQSANVEFDERTAAGIALRPGQYAVLEIAASSGGASPTLAFGGNAPAGIVGERGRGTSGALSDAARVLNEAGGGFSVHDTGEDSRTFRIYLPGADNPPASGRDPEAGHQGGEETILLLEDDESLATVIVRMLRTHGYIVLRADTGDAALTMAETFDGPIHVLLSDVAVPGTNGMELVRRLAAIRPHLRVLFMSGYAPQSWADDFPFLRKPFEPEALSQKLREVLDADSRRR